MKTKNVYSYDSQTGEYLGETTAHESPRELGKYLIPANATETAPPKTGEHETAMWDGKAWQVVEDWRGRDGYINGEPTTIEALGPLPAGWSDTPPEPSEKEKAEMRKGEILAKLSTLDAQSIRPTREIAEAAIKGEVPPQRALDELAKIEGKAEDLRFELKDLEKILSA